MDKKIKVLIKHIISWNEKVLSENAVCGRMLSDGVFNILHIYWAGVKFISFFKAKRKSIQKSFNEMGILGFKIDDVSWFNILFFSIKCYEIPFWIKTVTPFYRFSLIIILMEHLTSKSSCFKEIHKKFR